MAFFTFLAFVPFAIMLITANLASRDRVFRLLTFAGLAGLSFTFGLLGVTMLAVAIVDDPAAQEAFAGLPADFRWMALGFLVGGAGGLLPLIPGLRDVIASSFRLDPANVVHLTTTSFIFFLVGLSLVQIGMLGGADLAAVDDFELGAIGHAELWAQALGLILVTVAGLGLGFKRDFRSWLKRLGLQRPTAAHLIIGIAVVAVFLGFEWAWSRITEALTPGVHERIGSLTERLLAGLTGLPGALTIGLSAAIGEELVFRGALQPRIGLLPTAFLFTLIHIQYGLTLVSVAVFVLAIGLGLVRHYTNLTTCILVHAAYNMLVMLLSG